MQICLGDTRWCDGLARDTCTHSMVAALALADSSIQIVNWSGDIVQDPDRGL